MKTPLLKTLRMQFGLLRASQRCSFRQLRVRCRTLLTLTSLTIISFPLIAHAQRPVSPDPVIVQPGAPGQPTKTLPPSTKGVLPPKASADVQFMQSMILHHAQAIEMTAMIPSHTENRELRSLGARISSSQADEMKFMKRWLAARGEEVPKPMPSMSAMNMSSDAMSHDTMASEAAPPNHMALMPGMLSPEQMEALQKARGSEFDRLFLLGMIQHHNGALTMVKNLFDTAGAGQDAELFDFATDADNTQRAEIRIMQNMLEKKSVEENR
jgi:uncharacterized protein (DUF305 family)